MAAVDLPPQAGMEGVFRIGRHPSVAGRLLAGDELELEDLAAYRGRGGAGGGLEGPALLEAIAAAGLRGRGGAAFPTATKLAAVAAGEAPRHVVANGAEGEPASVKDRYLLRHRPHAVLDGLLRVTRAVGAERATFYVADPASARSVRRALSELDDTGTPVDVVEVAAGYVAGEETSAVRAIDGGEAKPVLKPPRPFEAGVGGRPTAVVNVETLANVPFIAREGAAEFRRLGSPASPGTFLLTLSGALRSPGLYELPLGLTLGEAIEQLGVELDGEIAGVLAGGFFGGLIGGERALGLPLGYDEYREASSSLGCGALVLLGERDCPVAVAADVMSYLAVENARQCGPCFRGTETLRDALVSLTDGTASDETLARLERVMPMMLGRGVCATPDAAVALVASLLREFPAVVAEHLAGPCERCAAAAWQLINPGSRFAIPLTEEGAIRDAHRD